MQQQRRLPEHFLSSYIAVLLNHSIKALQNDVHLYETHGSSAVTAKIQGCLHPGAAAAPRDAQKGRIISRYGHTARWYKASYVDLRKSLKVAISAAAQNVFLPGAPSYSPGHTHTSRVRSVRSSGHLQRRFRRRGYLLKTRSFERLREIERGRL